MLEPLELLVGDSDALKESEAEPAGVPVSLGELERELVAVADPLDVSEIVAVLDAVALELGDIDGVDVGDGV